MKIKTVALLRILMAAALFFTNTAFPVWAHDRVGPTKQSYRYNSTYWGRDSSRLVIRLSDGRVSVTDYLRGTNKVIKSRLLGESGKYYGKYDRMVKKDTPKSHSFNTKASLNKTGGISGNVSNPIDGFFKAIGDIWHRLFPPRPSSPQESQKPQKNPAAPRPSSPQEPQKNPTGNRSNRSNEVYDEEGRLTDYTETGVRNGVKYKFTRLFIEYNEQGKVISFKEIGVRNGVKYFRGREKTTYDEQGRVSSFRESGTRHEKDGKKVKKVEYWFERSNTKYDEQGRAIEYIEQGVDGYIKNGGGGEKYVTVRTKDGKKERYVNPDIYLITFDARNGERYISFWKGGRKYTYTPEEFKKFMAETYGPGPKSTNLEK